MARLASSLLLLVVILGSFGDSSGQWRKVYDFNDFIGQIYFFDLQGPPRLGYIGTERALWKTTDGGNSWKKSWSQAVRTGPTTFCFKDSLIGWAGCDAIDYTNTGLLRTTDGGNSWHVVPSTLSPLAIDDVAYCSATNRLFCSVDDTIKVSTDLGDSWQPCVAGGGANFSFITQLIGIVKAKLNDSTFGILRTTDGGLHWDFIHTPFAIAAPLAIKGTSTYFAAELARIKVYRSDDYGLTWDSVYDFGPYQDSNFNEIGPYGTGVIAGDLNRLYVQSDSGMYVSFDQGRSWHSEGQPTSTFGGGIYSANGVALASRSYNTGIYTSDGLWEEDWPTSSVESPIGQPLFTSDKIEIFDLVGRCVYRGPKEMVPALPPGAYIERNGGIIQKILR